MTEQDFGDEIDRIVIAHTQPRVEALFVMPIIAWTVFGFSGIAFAAWWASR